MSGHLLALLSIPIIGILIIGVGCGGCGGASKIVDVDDKKEIPVITKKTSSNPASQSPFSTEFDLGILKDAPMLPLVDADIREVYDHYILQSENLKRKYQLYDGIKQQEIEIATDETLEISGNQKYMLKYKLKENKLAKQYFFDVEIRNTSNEILSKGIIPAVGEDNYESHDALYPFNNGKGFVIMSEYPDKVTVYSADKNEFSISGTILNQNKALAGFIMTDDASDIVCLFYDENTYKSYLENYKLSNGQLIKKWEKRPSGKHAQFSNFNGLYQNSGNFKLINILTFSEEQADGLEVYTLDGDLILKKYLTNCSEFESYNEGNIITYIGTTNNDLQYLSSKGELLILDLKKVFGMDASLSVRIKGFINLKNHIVIDYQIYPPHPHKEYMTGLFSGIGILPKSDLSKGKYYPIYKNSALKSVIKNDTLYLLKGYGSLYPDLIHKIKLPLPF